MNTPVLSSRIQPLWIAAILLAIALAAVPVGTGRAAANSQDRRTRWEYATLVRQHQPGKREERWSYAGGDQRMNSVTLDELYQKFRIDNPETASELSVLDKLGDDGWELVSQSVFEAAGKDPEQAFVTERFMFKRAR